ncbi:hypothetical protein [[Clostridium] symbiosum]|uniref:hypothetical protein n=1 Tax=Clostridium symbiosum TaxID=1512 RepID=UPI00319E55B5
MEFLLSEIEKALENELYFIALQTTLSLPDICGALQSEDGKASKIKYICWYNKYVKNSKVLISAEECYNFRCSCLHQGTSQHPKSSYTRIIFLYPNKDITMHNNILGDSLNIDLIIFCKSIINAVRKWGTEIYNDTNYLKNYERLIRIYPNGIPTYIVGIPVIS